MMGTRSVVGYVNGDGFRGRFHHWDGYPTGKGAGLYRILHETFQGDAEAMLKVLCEDHASWSITDPGRIALDSTTDDGRFLLVPHVGIAHNPEPMDFMGDPNYRQTDMDWWITQDDTDTDCEWAYAIHPDTLTMSIFALATEDYGVDYRNRVNRWEPVAFVRLDGPEPDFETIETEYGAKVEAQWEAQTKVP